MSNELNNPFSSKVPEIAKVAVTEFQNFIVDFVFWKYDLKTRKGKMLGIGGYIFISYTELRSRVKVLT
jgi:hypothetical protein